MHKLLKVIAPAAMVALTSAAPAPAAAQTVYCTNCSNVVTQALQQAAQAEQLANQISQLQTQVQAYQNMLKNTAKLPDAIFGDALSDIQKVTSTIKAVKGLAYTAVNLEEQFKSKYGSLDSYLSGGMSSGQLQARYKAISTDTNESVLSTLKVLGQAANGIETDAQLLSTLQNRAASADGQMQALAVGNELAGLAASQIQKLQQLQVLAMQMHATQLQRQQDKEAAELARALETYTAFSGNYAGKRY